MRRFTKILLTALLIPGFFVHKIHGQDHPNLGAKEATLIRIAALTGKGDLGKLAPELHAGLEAGWSVRQIQEVLVHVYAYAGFPRSIRGLQTFLAVVEERRAKGIEDVVGHQASPVTSENSKYVRGKAVLEELTGVAESGTKTGYAAFAPVIEVFLKEHLFADIFERDVLNYKERQLVTVSVLSSIGGVEPMLRSHFNLCLNVGWTAIQLQQFVESIKSAIGVQEAYAAKAVLDEVLQNRK